MLPERIVFMKKKIVTRIVILAVVTLCLTGAGFAVGMGSAPKSDEISRTLVLQKTTLQDTVSTTGVIESVDITRVYSATPATILTQPLNVGDVVTKGQVLCEIDATSLKSQITQQEAQLSTTARQAAQQVEAARKNYETYAQNMNAGDSTNVLSGLSQIESAKASVDQAQIKLDSLKNDYSDEAQEYRSSRERLNEAKEDLKAAETSGVSAAITAAQMVLDQAEAGYDIARNAYQSSATAFEQAEISLDSAKKSYDAAHRALSSSLKGNGQQLKSLEDSLNNAIANADNHAGAVTLQNLRKQLKDYTVISPCDGTITAVYAKAGATASGLLYLIEDTSKLQVATSIKEYDVTSVKPGLKAFVTADATKDQKFSGTLATIDPTSKKSQDGSTIAGATVEFPATITVDDVDTPLRIGMNTRVSLVLQEKTDVFAVPYDAVVPSGSGNIVYAVDTVTDGEKTSHVARAVKVQTGLENDFFIEIQGSLNEGMVILLNPEGIVDGAPVRIE